MTFHCEGIGSINGKNGHYVDVDGKFVSNLQRFDDLVGSALEFDLSASDAVPPLPSAVSIVQS